jgi:uncharacterized protein (DUF2062 family)
VAKLGQEAVLVMLVGGVALATPIAFIGYVVSLRFFTAMHEKRLKKAGIQKNEN